MGIKERPILFGAQMVQAILGGRKTQTRRIIENQPTPDNKGKYNFTHSTDDEAIDSFWTNKGFWHARCPYGKPEDRLWVRETFLGWFNTKDRSFSRIAAYKADGYELEEDEKWIPSIHMPRSASRILLEITNIGIERLNDIGEKDAYEEGTELWAEQNRPSLIMATQTNITISLLRTAHCGNQ